MDQGALLDLEALLGLLTPGHFLKVDAGLRLRDKEGLVCGGQRCLEGGGVGCGKNRLNHILIGFHFRGALLIVNI